MNFVVPLQLGVRDVAFPVLNSREFLADRRRRAARQYVSVRRANSRGPAGWPTRRCPSLPTRRASAWTIILWSLQISGLGTLARRHQSHHHHTEAARAGHGLRAHADILLDGARLESADCRGLPDPHRHLCHAAARPLPRLSLLHERRGRQPHDVHQSHLVHGAIRKSTS